MKFGICMEGNETAFGTALERALRRYKQRPQQYPFTYVEIGMAGGGTHAGVVEVLQRSGVLWQSVGFDLLDGWSFNRAEVEARLGPTLHPIGPTDVLEPYHANLILVPGAQVLNSAHWMAPIHFAFIDGCHGYPCVVDDFMAVEQHCLAGSIVVFHDVNIGCQGVHMQPHCQTGIDVRRALEHLGLLGNRRHGWTFVQETTAPHAVAIVERA